MPKKWYESKNWFEGATTKEEIKAIEKKLLRKYHPDKNVGNAEAGEIYKTILNQYEALPINRNMNKQETFEERVQRQKMETHEDFMKRNTYSSVKNLYVQRMGMNYTYASKFSKDEVKDFFIKNYSTIEIDSTGKFTANSKPIAEFISKMAMNEEFSINKFNSFANKYTSKSIDSKMGVKLNMEYLNYATKKISEDIYGDDLENIAVVSGYDYKFEKAVGILKGFQDLGINFKLNTVDKDGKITSTETVDFSNEGENKALDKVKLAGINHLYDETNVIDRQKAFYNMLIPNTVMFDYNNAPHLFCDSTDSEGIDATSRLDRAKQMADNIASSNESILDDNEPHNRDKMNDLAKLYNAYRELNGNKPSVDLGIKILNKMDSLRIHNVRLKARDFEKSYISQQKIMDSIRKDIGKQPLNKWQDVEKKVGGTVQPETEIGKKLDIELPNHEVRNNNQQSDEKKEERLVVRRPIKISPKDLGENLIEDQKEEEVKTQISKGTIIIGNS